MRVYMNGRWHSPENDGSIVIELHDADKMNIKNMPNEATLYGVFPNNNSTTDGDRCKFMSELKQSITTT